MTMHNHPATKRVASVILPEFDNDGRNTDRAHEWLENELLTVFGGYTEQPVVGKWRDPATRYVYKDFSVRYDIVMDVSMSNDMMLMMIAKQAGALAKQKCVMVTHASGQVQFVQCEEDTQSSTGVTDAIDKVLVAGNDNVKQEVA